MRHFLNNIQIAPKNLDSIGVVSDFTGNPEYLRINVDSVILPREAKQIVQDHIAQVGLFEGIPYRVETDDNVTLQYYVDLLDNVKISDHEIQVKIKLRKSLDNFFERAEGTSWELMQSEGVQFQTHTVPYFVIEDNAFLKSIQLGVIVYLLGKETYFFALKVAEGVAQLIEAATPIPGLSPTGPVVSYNLGAILYASAVLLARIIYFGLILLALIELATQLFLVMFPPKRKFKGIYFRELCEKACSYLGYSFASDLLTQEPNWALVPVPLVPDRPPIYDYLPDQFVPVLNGNVPGSSDTTPTILSFFRAMESMFNARTIVRNNEVRIESRDWLQAQSNNAIQVALVDQGKRTDNFTFNTEEAWKRYYIRYATDGMDLNTMESDIFDIHDAELSCEPSFGITNQDLVTIKGLNEVQIPFALARRKDKLSPIEFLAKITLASIDALTGLFGGGTNFEAQVDSRKDAMRISQNYFGTTKVLYGEVGAVKPNEIIQEESYTNFVSAISLWNRFHYINAIENNDYKVKENVRIRISSQDFVSLLFNNYAEINGVICEILRIEWLDEKSFAEITYKERNQWASGKVNTIVIDS